MESLAAALLPNTNGPSTETASQSNANLNRLLDEITFRLERRFLLRLFDKHGIPSSELDKLPPIPNCHCQCKSLGDRDAISSSAPSTSGYEDIEILRYRARMVVDNVVGDALQCEHDNIQYDTEDGATSARSKEADMFATIGGPDNMSATNSLYVVRRAALRTLLKYTRKGKAGALLHLTDYLQQQIDNIDEENAALDTKAKTRKPKVRFDPIVEENNEEFDDAIDEYDDILPELPEPINRSKKRVVKIQAGSGESQSDDPVSLDSNYTFNLRKFARHSLSKYLHKTDAAAAMMHLFESTTRLELADDFAEIHASDSDMQELLHTPYSGLVAGSGAAPKKKDDAYPNKYNRSTQVSSASPDWNRRSDVPFSKDPEKRFTNYQPHQSRGINQPYTDFRSSPNRFLSSKDDARRYPEKPHATRDDRYNNLCSYCRSYLNEMDVNMTTNNSNHQYLPSELQKCPTIQNDNNIAIRGTSTTNNAKKEKTSIGMSIENDTDTSVGIGDFSHQQDSATDMFTNKINADDMDLNDCPKACRDVEAPQLESKPFEYNPSTKKVIRLESTSSSNRPDDVKDQEITVSQKVGYFDRILNPSTEDVRTATKKAESFDISDETRVKIGFWEKMCGCCHSNPYK